MLGPRTLGTLDRPVPGRNISSTLASQAGVQEYPVKTLLFLEYMFKSWISRYSTVYSVWNICLYPEYRGILRYTESGIYVYILNIEVFYGIQSLEYMIISWISSYSTVYWVWNICSYPEYRGILLYTESGIYVYILNIELFYGIQSLEYMFISWISSYSTVYWVWNICLYPEYRVFLRYIESGIYVYILNIEVFYGILSLEWDIHTVSL